MKKNNILRHNGFTQKDGALFIKVMKSTIPGLRRFTEAEQYVMFGNEIPERIKVKEIIVWFEEELKRATSQEQVEIFESNIKYLKGKLARFEKRAKQVMIDKASVRTKRQIKDLYDCEQVVLDEELKREEKIK